MDDKLILQPKNTPGDNQILVSKEKLKILLDQNKQYKDENAQLLNMLNNSVDVIDFIKNKIFGGQIPKDISVGQLVKIATRVPRVLNSLDESTITNISTSMKSIVDCAANFLDDTQIKKLQ